MARLQALPVLLLLALFRWLRKVLWTCTWIALPFPQAFYGADVVAFSQGVNVSSTMPTCAWRRDGAGEPEDVSIYAASNSHVALTMHAISLKPYNSRDPFRSCGLGAAACGVGHVDLLIDVLSPNGNP